MKEIRTTKMVEQTEVKFIADDGKVFIGEHAESECATYERRISRENVEKAFERLDVKEIAVPVIEWWYGDYTKLWKVTLHSKKDYLAFTDYLYEVIGVYKGDLTFEEPKEYPYTTLIGAGCEWAYEYSGNMKEDLQKMIDQLD